MDHCIQHQQQNSGLTRFGSALSSYQESLIGGDGIGREENQWIQSPSQELEDRLARYYGFEENCMKEEDKEFVSQPNGYFNGSEMIHSDLAGKKCSNGNSFDNYSFGTESRIGSETDSRDGSSLGFGAIKDLESFRGSHNLKGEDMNLASEPSSSNPRVTPNAPDFCNESWDKTYFGVLNGSGGNNINFSGTNTLETHTGKSKNRLTHHLSLPASFSNKSAMGNLLHFQESVQFKTRAKRGFATHPRSIAERERRTRISERIRKLQDLVPNMDKQTNTAEMLDMAVEHIKELQKQVKALTDTRARCTCASKEKQIGSCS